MWLLCAAAMAGPWAKEAGQAYVKAGADWYRTTKYVLPDEGTGLGSTGDQATTGFFGHQYSLYAEVGLSDQLPFQVAARVPMTWSVVGFEAEDLTRAVEGTAHTVRWGDMEIAPQIALSKKAPLALGVIVKVPLYGVDRICKGSVYRDFCGRPGDGQFDFSPYFNAGGSLLKGKSWVELLVGWRFRTEIFNDWDTERKLKDGLFFGGVWGFKLGPFLPMLRVDGILTVGEIAQKLVQKTYRRDGFTAERVTVGPAFLFDIAEGVAFEGRGGFDVYARNTSVGISFGTGISWRR